MHGLRARSPLGRLWRAPDKRQAVDVLLVRGDTTLGLLRGNDTFARAVSVAGASVAQVRPRYRLKSRVKRLTSSQWVDDLCEALELRLVTSWALTRVNPTSIVYCITTAAWLQPRSRLGSRSAVRFDSPCRLSRRGGLAPLEHALECRAFSATGMLLPWGVHPRAELLDALPAATPVVPLPIPIVDAQDGDKPRREPIAVTYGGSPGKKRLDVAVEAWRRVSPPGVPLVVAGIEESIGRQWLASRGIDLAGDLRWVGRLDRAAFRRLLRSAEYFIAASRFEDHGIAQLEAMYEGALLVTVPSRGPYEPLAVAQRLAPGLVAADLSTASLANAFSAALSLLDEERAMYRERARDLLAEYSENELVDRLSTRVLPELVGAGQP